jgi:hypothetical protein
MGINLKKEWMWMIDAERLRKDAFWKGLKVIESCENTIHIDAAEKYVKSFFFLFSDYLEISTQHDTLLVALREKKLKLKL